MANFYENHERVEVTYPPESDTLDDFIRESASLHPLPLNRRDFVEAVSQSLKNALIAHCGESSFQAALEAFSREKGSRFSDSLMWIISKIANAKNPRYLALVLGSAAGLNLREGQSDTQTAQECGVSKQAFCRQVGKWQELLHLPKTRGQKSPESSDSYSKSNKRNFKHYDN